MLKFDLLSHPLSKPPMDDFAIPTELLCPTTGQTFRPHTYRRQQVEQYAFLWAWCPLCDSSHRTAADPGFDPEGVFAMDFDLDLKGLTREEGERFYLEMVERVAAVPGVRAALAIPLFSVWLLVYDRQTQSEQAAASITEGWGGPQAVSGPLLVIPYRARATETEIEGGHHHEPPARAEHRDRPRPIERPIRNGEPAEVVVEPGRLDRDHAQTEGDRQ